MEFVPTKLTIIGLTLMLSGYSLSSLGDTSKESGRPVPDVVLFSMDFCPSCMAAKKYLHEREIEFSEFNIDQSEKARDVFERLGGQGAPFFLIEGKRVQGFHPHQFDQLLVNQSSGEERERP